jgi:hypothetical protein
MDRDELLELTRSKIARRNFFLGLAVSIASVLFVRYYVLTEWFTSSEQIEQQISLEGTLNGQAVKLAGRLPMEHTKPWADLVGGVLDELLIVEFSIAILAAAFLLLTPRVMARANISAIDPREISDELKKSLDDTNEYWFRDVQAVSSGLRCFLHSPSELAKNGRRRQFMFSYRTPWIRIGCSNTQITETLLISKKTAFGM